MVFSNADVEAMRGLVGKSTFGVDYVRNVYDYFASVGNDPGGPQIMIFKIVGLTTQFFYIPEECVVTERYVLDSGECVVIYHLSARRADDGSVRVVFLGPRSAKLALVPAPSQIEALGP